MDGHVTVIFELFVIVDLVVIAGVVMGVVIVVG